MFGHDSGTVGRTAILDAYQLNNKTINIMGIFAELNFSGLFIGLCTFIIIGLFHPLVIKGEYYFGEKIKWAFAAGGVLFTVLTLLISDVMWGAISGVAAFSSFWGILEIKEQVERVRKGWFPANPKRAKKELSERQGPEE